MDLYGQRDKDVLAVACVRGACRRRGIPALDKQLLDTPLGELTQEQKAEIIRQGKAAEIKLYRFKDSGTLPRVQAVIGFLRGIWPESVLDVGSGRGVFLFPFLCAFPGTPVTSLDLLDHRAEFLEDVRQGGIEELTVHRQDICTWDMPDNSFDVVTMLEVLEHIPDVERAVRAAVQLARRYVIVTVPSKEDDNPEHIHLLTKERLTELFGRAGCCNLSFGGVNGHLFMPAQVLNRL